ncbi:cupin domain-containing protein [Hydrogenimonas sp. SS33]|uniref:cupin domain-containing protein n=1 Tax=Hydrogenimonas leucolamina TaxID=2954236 RepID=UPI00336BC601
MLTNLFEKAIPHTSETFETLLHNDHLTIEAIISSDRPDPLLYDQDHDEAVLLLEGSAHLWIEGRKIVLKPGDFLHIPAHTRHKVLSTDRGTRWLAIHTREPLC